MGWENMRMGMERECYFLSILSCSAWPKTSVSSVINNRCLSLPCTLGHEAHASYLVSFCSMWVVSLGPLCSVNLCPQWGYGKACGALPYRSVLKEAGGYWRTAAAWNCQLQYVLLGPCFAIWNVVWGHEKFYVFSLFTLFGLVYFSSTKVSFQRVTKKKGLYFRDHHQ